IWSLRAISACERLPAANRPAARRRRSCMAAKSRRGALDRVMPYSLRPYAWKCHYIMRGSVIGGLRQAIQDLVAPDLKSIQAKQDAMDKRMELQYDTLRRQIEV